jgi:hypothetical protein
MMAPAGTKQGFPVEERSQMIEKKIEDSLAGLIT